MGIGPALGPGGRAVLDLGVERVRPRRLDGLVVDGHRPVLEADGREEPPKPVAVDDKGPVARYSGVALGVRGWLVVGSLGGVEVRHVEARPLPLLLVPPDILLALGPGLAARVSRGAVVEDASARRPRP